MAKSPYDTDLDRNAANFQPLTPLTLLERAAAVFPDRTAIVHGALRRSYTEFYARSRRLASALAKRGIKRGDAVSAILANTPAMLECQLASLKPPTHARCGPLRSAGDAATPTSLPAPGTSRAAYWSCRDALRKDWRT